MVYTYLDDEDDDDMLPGLPNLDSFTTATIEQHFDEIGVWEVGQQVVLRNPTTREPFIHHRSFNTPILPLPNPFYVRPVEIPYEEWPSYYRLETKFQSEEYNSSGDFYKWERGVQTHTLEILRYNRKSSYLNWVRPPNLQTPTPVIMLPTSTKGGVGAALSSGRPTYGGISKPMHPATISHAPVTLVLSTGKALGLEITLSSGEPEPDPTKPVVIDPENPPPPISQGDIKVEYPKGTTVTGKFDVFPSDEVYVTTTAYAIKAIFYGEEVYQSTAYPSQLIDDAEDEVLVHQPGTPFANRLLPPGKVFRQDFWNNPGRADPEVKGYQTRKAKQWKVL